MQPGTVGGAVFEFHAARANLGENPGINSPLTTQAFDTSGNANHGTLTNFDGNEWSGDGTAASPRLLTFNGTDEYIGNAAPTGLDAAAVTIELWFVPPAAQGSWVDLATYKTTASNDNYGWRIVQNGATLNQYIFYWGTGAAKVGDTAALALTAGALAHCVWTHDGSTVNRYKNGAASGAANTGESAIAYNASVLRLMKTSYYATYTAGSLAVARIYPRALTAPEVAQNYAAGTEWAREPRTGIVVPRLPAGMGRIKVTSPSRLQPVFDARLWNLGASVSEITDSAGGSIGLLVDGAAPDSHSDGLQVGTNSFTFADHPAINLGASERTISAWVNFDVVNVKQAIWCHRAGAADGWWLYLESDGKPSAFLSESYALGMYRSAKSTAALSASTLYHIAAVWRAGDWSLYVNAVLQGKTSTGTVGPWNTRYLDTYTPTLAAHHTMVADTDQLDGRLARTTIYRRALSAAEITELYAFGFSGDAGSDSQSLDLEVIG